MADRSSRPGSTSRSRSTAARGGSRPGGRPVAGRASSRPASAGGGTKASPQKRRPRSLRRVVIFGGLLVFLTVLLFPTLRNYLSQRDQIESLNSQVSQQRKDYDALQKQRARWDDPTYVQQQARERLGFAKPGEKAYIVVDDTGKKQNAQAEGVEGVQKAPAAASRAWYGQIWGSAVSAGQQDSDGTDSTK